MKLNEKKDVWNVNDTCYYNIENFDSTKKIVSFDYDETLCEKFTSILLPNVEKKLMNLFKEYNVCIFTNQLGISKEKTTHHELQSRLQEFKIKLRKETLTLNIKLNLQIFYSTEDDNYRKPMVGMFELMKSILKPIDVVYYCGDAAGRLNDFSRSDLYFANNCEVKFKTPEEIFHDNNIVTLLQLKNLKSYELYSKDIWINGQLENTRVIINYEREKILENININNEKKELIIMIGPQASGKSTITKYLSSKFNFGVINADNQKTKSTMKKAFKQYEQDLSIKGIIIDNTNPTKKSREEWKSYLTNPTDWNIKIIFIDISKLISFHLTKYRQNFTGIKIPSVAIHTYYKKLEKPTNNEGEIIIFNSPISIKSINQNLRFIM